MSKKKRLLSLLTTAVMLVSSVQLSAISEAQSNDYVMSASEDASLSASVSELLYSSSVIDGLNLNPKSYEHNGASDKYNNIGMKFVYSSRAKAYYVDNEYNSSYHPAGKNYFRPADYDDSSEWHVLSKWTLSSEEKEILKALISNNTLQMGGRFSGFWDTYNSHCAGEPRYILKAGRNDIFNYRMSKNDYSKNSFHDIDLGWVNLTGIPDTYELKLGSTAGYRYNGLIFNYSKNSSKLKSPEVFLRDATLPYVRYVNAVAKNDKKDFVYGDTIEFEIVFNEPVRISDYSKVELKVFGEKATPVSYSDKTKTLVVEYRVRDREQEQASAGNFSVNITVPSGVVSDLSGNKMDEINGKTFKVSSTAISGFVPRIRQIGFKYTSVRQLNGSYVDTDEAGVLTKPGDKLYFDILFNQNIKAASSGTSPKFKVNVGNELVDAELFGIVTDSGVEKCTNGLPSERSFRTLRYVLTIPESAVTGDKVYIPAKASGSKWELTDNSDFFSSLLGNETLGDSERRLSVVPVSELNKEGEYISGVLTVDSEGPKIRFTTADGDQVGFDNSVLADIKTTEKYDSYSFYVWSDEEVKGSVKLYLKYYPKGSPSEAVTNYLGETAAYTDETGISGGKEFTARINVSDIDSADYDVIIYADAADAINNRSEADYFFPVDNKKPEIEIIEKGVKLHSDNSRYYEIALSVEDRSTPDDLKLYYRTSSEDEFVSATAEQGFTIVGDSVSSGAEKYGVIQYYAEDALGNRTETFTEYYYIGDSTATVSIVDEESYAEYIVPKTVEFTGFRAPVTEGDKIIYDYLGYRVGDGEFTYIKNTDGNNISIPTEDLPFEDDVNSNFILTYKLVRGFDESELDLSAATEKFLIYHYDTKDPDYTIDLVNDMYGNISSIFINAPKDHISNISSAELSLIDNEGEMIYSELLHDGGSYIKDGVLMIDLNIKSFLDNAGCGSGTYSIYIKVTDKNGHTSEGVVIENGRFVIEDPEIKHIAVSDAQTDVTFVETENTSDDIYVGADAVRNAIAASDGKGACGYEYKTSVRIASRYDCGEYDEFSSKGFSYIYSINDGQTWSNYTDEGLVVISEETEYTEYDGERYAFCDLEITLPEIPDGTSENYKIMIRSEATKKISPIFSLVLHGDRSGPVISADTVAVGSDENGWSEKIDFTNEYVKAIINAEDKGFCNDFVSIELLSASDLTGQTVENIDDYAVISDNGDGTAELIFKESCKVIVSASDIFGNTTEYEYGTDLIDDIKTKYTVYNSNETEVYAYVVLENVRNYILTAEPVGSLDASEAGNERYKQFVEDSVIVNQHFKTLHGARDGDINVAFRIYQRNNVTEPYDIICGMYDRYGNYQTFKIMTVECIPEQNVNVSEYTNTVTNLGKTIRAVQKLEFDQPVAQLSSVQAAIITDSKFDTSVIGRDDLMLVDMVFSNTLYAVLDHNTQGNVFVTDKYGNISHIKIDTSGTEFVDYAGYTVEVIDERDDDSISVGSDHIFGANSNIVIKFSGNNGTSAFKVDSRQFSVSNGEIVDVGSMEFYDSTELTASSSMFDGEGTYHAANIRVANLANGDIYNDVIVLGYDTAPPVHLYSYVLAKKDATEPDSVIYMFYDRRGFSKVEEDTGSGFEEQATLIGIHRSYYNDKTAPVVRVTDVNGNILTINGPEVDGAVSVSTLREGIDYVIDITDAIGKKVEDGSYYDMVYVSISKTPAGKSFTCEPAGRVYTDSEAALTFKLTESSGVKKTVIVQPPVDRTAPSVKVYQDSYGSLVSGISYTLHVKDLKSGIDRVSLRRADGEGEEIILEKKSETSDYSIYTFMSLNSDEYIAEAVDKLGNSTEVSVVSNSKVAEMFELEVTYSTKLITNKNVKVSLRAKDGRRIYTNVIPFETTKPLGPQDYLISGNDIMISKNGEMMVSVTDELENEVKQVIVITNIDMTPPTVKATVEQVEDDQGKKDDSFARIRFTASGEDENIPGAVRLLRLRNDIENAGFTTKELHDYWTQYTQNPEEFKETQEFKDICEMLFDHDITSVNTYVDVTSNGTHTFYFIDKAGNGTMLDVRVDCIDSTPPVITGVKWMFEYLAGESFDKTETSEGMITDLSEKKLDISEESTGHITNRDINIEITTDEESVIYGSSMQVFMNTLRNIIKSNGVYKFIVSDNANNHSEVTVNVTNILKDELYIELEYTDDIVVFENKTDTFRSEYITGYKVYKYDGEDNKVYLTEDQYTSKIDFGGLDHTNISNNTFDSTMPYTITYTAWDKAGNKAERSKKVTLCSSDDIMVTVNGKLPEISGQAIVGSAAVAPGYVMIDGKEVDVRIENYSGPASVKIAEGQYNGAQMKVKGKEIPLTDDKYHVIADKTGWYTVSVRTIHQDIFVIRIYVTVD